MEARQNNAAMKIRRVRKAQAFSAQGDRYRTTRLSNASEYSTEQANDFDHEAFRTAIREGLDKGEFRLFYQPKINARTLEATGAECLLRWRRAARLGLTTLEFIQRAEASGCIGDLTEWVISEVTSTLGKCDCERDGFKLAINVSSSLLGNENFLDIITDDARVHADRIVIEITETAIFASAKHAISNLEALSDMGFHLSLDDFGTGYSSLLQLQRLPLDELKIDRDFITDLVSSHKGPLLVRTAIDLAHALECTLVAEGIEDAETMALLTVMGCDEMQGYFIAKPMPGDELRKWLARDDHEFRKPTPMLGFGN